MSADPTTAAATPPVPLAHAAGDVVLIVDDVPDNLSLLHDALDEAGYTVLVATSRMMRCLSLPRASTST